MTNENRNSSSWKYRTSLEKKLTLINIFFVIASVALLISLILVISRNNDIEEYVKKNFGEVISQPIVSNPAMIFFSEKREPLSCLTPGCIRAATQLLEMLDSDVEPCDDFYSFACGSFLNNTIIPDDQVAVNSFSIVGDRLQVQLKLLVSEKSKPNETKPFRLAKDLYKACMNESLIEERGFSPFLTIVQNLGGWPVLVGNSWNETSWTWEKLVKDFRRLGYGSNYIISAGVGADVKNSSKHILYIDEFIPGLSRTSLIKGLNETVVQAYYNFMVDLTVILGANREVAEKDIKDSLEFEYALANITLSPEERRDENKLYNSMTLIEVQKNYPYINWIDYINSLLTSETIVDENEVVIVKNPIYLVELGKLLAKTPKKTIANYMFWRSAQFSSYLLTKQLRNRQLDFEKIVSGRQEMEARWKECISVVNGGIYVSVSALYVKKYFKENAKLETVNMVNGIRAEFENILKNIKWMDEKTKAAAQKKLKSIASHIGYPDELMDNQKLEEYFKKLEIDPTKYFESVLNMVVFGNDNNYDLLKEPVNKTDWVSHGNSANVNAYYNPSENSIEFPAGILQGQIFSVDRPRYLNYGAIGAIVGHEFTHGFDDEGKQYDQDGNLVDWWEPDTTTAYLEKAKCIIEQYGNFTESMTGLNLNGINTQGENIADNGGVKEAYLAYKKWVETHQPELKLPGFKYTPEQLFWISFGQTWCSVNRPESIKVAIETDVHSPTQFRVLGPLKNLNEFSKDFNCPEGSPMNPIKKCEVW